MASDRPDIPFIVTTDLSSSNDLEAQRQRAIDNQQHGGAESSASPATPPHSAGHARSPSGNLLSPDSLLHVPGRTSSDGPHSPSSPSYDSSTTVPPSPTLSAHSQTSSQVHFNTSVALRTNEPGNGLTSLGLLQSGAADKTHDRKGSAATFNSATGASVEGTEPDAHGRVSPVPSRNTTVTAVSASPNNPEKAQTPLPSSKQATKDKKKDKKDKKDKKKSKKDKKNNKSSGDEGDSSDSDGEDDESATRPGPVDPNSDITDPTPFEFKPLILASLVDPKNLPRLKELGGADGLIKGLGTHRTKGLTVDGASGGDNEKLDGPAYKGSFEDRKRVYGDNIVPARKSKGLLLLMWLALKDKVLILLSVAAIISLALGLYQTFGVVHPPILCSDDGRYCPAPAIDWVEGVAILIAILIVIIVGSVNDYQKERQFRSLNEKKEDRGVKVVRDGKEQIINIKEVVVGDIALLEPGEIVPVDGVFLRGHNVRCDESGATGESDAIKKYAYEEVVEDTTGKKDCFMISGSKVLEGVGEYVVIAVGQKSFNGRIMMALRGDTENTPLQLKLNALAELIAKLGSSAGLALFTALMIRFFVRLGSGVSRTPNEWAMNFVQILIISVTLIVVAVPEGLPLAVTLALAFATKRMTKEQLLVRVLGSCETMANANVVCTDKTGTLTTNVMTVVAGSVGVHAKFVAKLKENLSRTNAEDQPSAEDASDPEKGNTKPSERKFKDDFSIDQADLNSILSKPLQRLFNESIAINSTAFEDKNPETGAIEFVGSKTETALLRFAQELGWDGYKQTRDSAKVMQMIPFSSERKAMGVVIQTSDNKYRLYLKGASEILTKLCASRIVVGRPGQDSSGKDQIETVKIDETDRDNISRTIIFYANQTLRTIAICYRDLESWPPKGVELDGDEVPYKALAQDLTLIGITGIEDPLRPGVRDAVATCHKAGVTVKMCTGDNVLTARSIATQCGIYTPGGIIMEGPVFRELNDSELLEVVPRLQVLARSSPEDKKLLVETLKKYGDIVGVTGDGTNDGPALKTANVGFSMGIAGTEVAKEASDIIVMDDNFRSIVSAIMWGRCVNDSVRRFLQFQISVNITAVIITFVSAVSSDEEESVLTAVQLLWINIIMDTFAALALATDPATPKLLDRKPDKKTAPLFTVDMRKQILGQSMYQTFIILLFHFIGYRALGYDPRANEFRRELNHQNIQTMVFNAFVFAQIFNSINCRRIDNQLNVFEGITKNYYFILITLLEIGIQIAIIFVGGAAFQVRPIPGREWGISIALGFVSIPLGALIRLIPNGPIEKFFIAIRFMDDPNAAPLPTKRPDEEKAGWNEAISQVRDNLTTFATIRGGRMRGSSFVAKSRTAQLEEADIKPANLLAMVPTLVASSVGAGWTSQPQHLGDPAQVDPSRSSAALWEGKLQLHPETAKDDAAYKKWGAQMEKSDEEKQ